MNLLELFDIISARGCSFAVTALDYPVPDLCYFKKDMHISV